MVKSFLFWITLQLVASLGARSVSKVKSTCGPMCAQNRDNTDQTITSRHAYSPLLSSYQQIKQLENTARNPNDLPPTGYRFLRRLVCLAEDWALDILAHGPVLLSSGGYPATIP